MYTNTHFTYHPPTHSLPIIQVHVHICLCTSCKASICASLSFKADTSFCCAISCLVFSLVFASANMSVYRQDK